MPRPWRVLFQPLAMPPVVSRHPWYLCDAEGAGNSKIHLGTDNALASYRPEDLRCLPLGGRALDSLRAIRDARSYLRDRDLEKPQPERGCYMPLPEQMLPSRAGTGSYWCAVEPTPLLSSLAGQHEVYVRAAPKSSQ